MKVCIYGAGAIGGYLGVRFARAGADKTSMLQDLERGRPMEINLLVTVVQEMGLMTRIPTPALDAVLALVAQRAKIAGLYDGVVRPAATKTPVFA